MKIYQSKAFEKKVKKLSKNDKLALDKAVHTVIEKPGTGVEKKAIWLEYLFINTRLRPNNIY
ncbi:hypothetical protein CRYPA_2022 [uncultured Candidatus Thioglobus sp.]|nr:hypothetical protein CRYPA_2022 [uncultured Candidatus Thioglobus sp.]